MNEDGLLRQLARITAIKQVTYIFDVVPVIGNKVGRGDDHTQAAGLVPDLAHQPRSQASIEDEQVEIAYPDELHMRTAPFANHLGIHK